MIELSRYVLEALRKDEEFILYRGQSQDDTSQAAFANRLRQATERPDSSEVQSAGYGHDDLSDEFLAKSEALAEPGYGAPSDLRRVLVLSPVAEYPRPEILKRLEHAYSLKGELDPVWLHDPSGSLATGTVLYWCSRGLTCNAEHRPQAGRHR